MNLTLKVWRQKNKNVGGKLDLYQAKNISSDMSFLEMLDVVNEELQEKGFINTFDDFLRMIR